MTAVVTAIIFAAVMTLFFAAVAFFLRRLVRVAEDETSAKVAASIVPEKYAYSVEVAKSTLTLHNLQGDSTVTREMHGITPPEGVKLEKVSGTLTTSGTFEVPPYMKPVGGSRKLSFSTRQISENAYEYSVQIEDGLASTEKLDVIIETRLRRSNLMTKAEVEQAYANAPFKHEYHTLGTAVPVGELILEVNFPPDFPRTTTSVVVFHLDTEDEVPSETARVRPMLETGESSARLVVSKPQITYGYSIYWIPAR